MLSGHDSKKLGLPVVISLIMGAFAFSLCMNANLETIYSDFITGHLAWGNGNKKSDLLSLPITLVIILISYFLFYKITSIQHSGNEIADIENLGIHLGLWSIPGLLVIASTLTNFNAFFDARLIYLSIISIVYLYLSRCINLYAKSNFTALQSSLLLLCIVLLSFIPAAISLISNRFFDSNISAEYAVNLGCKLFFITLFLSIFFQLLKPQVTANLIPKLAFIAQTGALLFYLSIYPSVIVTNTGDYFKYKVGAALIVLIATIITYGIYDIVKRYTQFDKQNYSHLFSPVAIFGLLVALRLATTSAPYLNPDDYHFGETLLATSLLLQGLVPYVDFMPAHGMLDDGIVQLVSIIFYDGTAGSMPQSANLAFILMALVGFLAIYHFSKSIPLAFISTFLMGGRLSLFIFSLFICYWLKHQGSSSPSRWLCVWILSIPIILFLNPPQGAILIASSSFVALYYLIQVAINPKNIEWKLVYATIAILLALLLLTPSFSMLLGVINYILSNGSINQLAYGTPWSTSWSSGSPNWSYEAIRVSWFFALVFTLILFVQKKKNINNFWLTLASLMFLIIFTMLILPYSMGRIDNAGMTRPGRLSAFVWLILVPFFSWYLLSKEGKVLLLITISGLGACFGFSQTNLRPLETAIASRVNTQDIIDAKLTGIPKIGAATFSKAHLDRLQKVKSIVDREVAAEDTYIDFTSRNAHYFYFDKQPLIPVTAPYNMAAVSHQKKAIEILKQNPPKFALLEADNINHDGGGIALRNPLLFRYIVDTYQPYLENGIIYGLRRDIAPLVNNIEKVDLSISPITDRNWIAGINRNEAAVVVDKSPILANIKRNDFVVFPDGHRRRVTRVWNEGNAIWFEGPPFPTGSSYKYISYYPDENFAKDYSKTLFQSAFSRKDLRKIPISWGKSAEKLKSKMQEAFKLDKIAPKTNDLKNAEGSFVATGTDPYLVYDLSHISVSGKSADLLKFKFKCIDQSKEPRIQIFWWGDHKSGPFEESSLRFTAHNGDLIVPLDSSAWWIMTDNIKGIRIDLDNPGSCKAISVTNIGLHKKI